LPLICGTFTRGDPCDAPAALLMHGNEADPVFCYANRTAQDLWGLTSDEFIRLPSRLSAEPLVQAERDGLRARVRAHGFIDDYRACGSRRTARVSASRVRRGDGGGRWRDAWAGCAVPGVGAHLSRNFGRRRR
jgi:PAS domain-containing protein